MQQIELSIMETIQERRQLAEERLAKVTPDTMQFSVTPWAQAQIQKSLLCLQYVDPKYVSGIQA